MTVEQIKNITNIVYESPEQSAENYAKQLGGDAADWLDAEIFRPSYIFDIVDLNKYDQTVYDIEQIEGLGVFERGEYAGHTIAGSVLDVIQQQTARQVGTSSHAGFKYLTWEQYEKLAADPEVKDISYNIFIGFGVELDREYGLVADEKSMSCSMRYISVIGQGEITWVPEEEKAAALQILMRQYHKEDFPISAAMLPHTTVFKLSVRSLTAKRRL